MKKAGHYATMTIGDGPSMHVLEFEIAAADADEMNSTWCGLKTLRTREAIELNATIIGLYGELPVGVPVGFEINNSNGIYAGALVISEYASEMDGNHGGYSTTIRAELGNEPALTFTPPDQVPSRIHDDGPFRQATEAFRNVGVTAVEAAERLVEFGSAVGATTGTGAELPMGTRGQPPTSPPPPLQPPPPPLPRRRIRCE